MISYSVSLGNRDAAEGLFLPGTCRLLSSIASSLIASFSHGMLPMAAFGAPYTSIAGLDS